jgi:hypothetical protein
MAMTVAELRKLVESIPAEYDTLEVARDSGTMGYDGKWELAKTRIKAILLLH